MKEGWARSWVRAGLLNRYCKETNSLISDSIGVSFSINVGIPCLCLFPIDGKMIETADDPKI
ncbi:hypothetical protein NC653_013559 [Populus alba x Populus x berolinensis]|uniref:Uncharacterized protein n=1 Tax=Populus alba x Populus x berolinensis TaxID=444605 RepID=A0AAD6QUX1_9ROSI|nr:hypothetical protein NC653_013559 [Populus alba x Populus x berolinensis]